MTYFHLLDKIKSSQHYIFIKKIGLDISCKLSQKEKYHTLPSEKNKKYEPGHISYKIACAASEDSDQPVHLCSLAPRL